MSRLINYFCWDQMNKQFMRESAFFCRTFDKRLFYSASYGNFHAAVIVDDVTMMYTMGGEMQ